MSCKSFILAILALLVPFTVPFNVQGQTATSFEGLGASEIGQPTYEIDANGSVGTKQYMEWVNTYYQAYDKTTFAPVWSSPQAGDTPWVDSGMTNCDGTGGGEGTITFDRMASLWVIARRAGPASNVYYYCIAVSNTDDLTSPTLAWRTYQFNVTANLGINSHGNVYYPDFPRFGTWSNGYYATFDLEDPNNEYQEIGVVACAFDRSNMIIGGTARAQQCFSNPNPIPTDGALYLAHSLIPADVEGTTAPPTGRNEYFLSIENPPADGKSTTSNKLNLWTFRLNWTIPSESAFAKGQVTVATYEPGCYDVAAPVNTFCVPEPSTSTTANYVDSVGDRLEPRFAYRNFGTYQSFLISHTVQVGLGANQQTGIRWYELRGNGNPTLYQDGTITNGNTLYRFLPSIAQDSVGNAAVGYSVSSSTVHPGIRASYWSLPGKTKSTEILVENGIGDEENSPHWGNSNSMTVDPVDGCTFWYVNEYFAADQIGTEVNWDTRIANFKLPSCQQR
ncbi:MAG: hypothetical protein ABSE44_04735 [Candidatus Sulfotelmatobacter sp.]|jgi:hypothetical protein